MTQQIERYRCVVLGGGIHGCGVAHDLASRGWNDVLLVEKNTIGSGTSSRSTKLIHGGLRYLEHPRDYPLVIEGLRERRLLMQLAPDLVKPLDFIFPALKGGGMPAWMIRVGLSLYDFLAGSHGLQKHKAIDIQDALSLAPILDRDCFAKYFKFTDGQTDDLALVQRVASSARRLGVLIKEKTNACKVIPCDEGFRIVIEDGQGMREISCRYVVNAMGPWAHDIFESSAIKSKYVGVNNKGAHILVSDLGLKAGVFLQSPEDHRIFFVLPWLGRTLIGTTETKFNEHPDELVTSQEDIDYLLDHVNRYINNKLLSKDVIGVFSGLRWLAANDDQTKSNNLSTISRSHIVSEHNFGKGVLYTVYGGKLTAYRALSCEIGDKILKHFGDFVSSKTHLNNSWIGPDQAAKAPPLELRFTESKHSRQEVL